jgi:predicted nucleotidyltransferase
MLSIGEAAYLRKWWPVLSDLRSALRTEHNVRFALLFGSTSNGTATAKSDIDILVSMRDSSLDRVINLELKLEAALGKKVQVVRLEDAKKEPRFEAEALRSGRVLIDRDSLWPRLSKRAARIEQKTRSQQRRNVQDALAGIDSLLAT